MPGERRKQVKGWRGAPGLSTRPWADSLDAAHVSAEERQILSGRVVRWRKEEASGQQGAASRQELIGRTTETGILALINFGRLARERRPGSDPMTGAPPCYNGCCIVSTLREADMPVSTRHAPYAAMTVLARSISLPIWVGSSPSPCSPRSALSTPPVAWIISGSSAPTSGSSGCRTV